MYGVVSVQEVGLVLRGGSVRAPVANRRSNYHVLSIISINQFFDLDNDLSIHCVCRNCVIHVF